MKIALSLFGYYDTQSTGQSKGLVSYHKIDTFFKGIQHDTYIHCWQPQHKDLLSQLYSPIVIETEQQIDFSKVAESHGIDQAWFDVGFNRGPDNYGRATVFNSLSFFYTRSRALQLIKNIEEYDLVFTMRLDVGNVGPDEVNFPHTFKFDSPTDKIYTPFWNQINVGYGDMWTILGGSKAKTLSNIYNRVVEYLKPSSDYVKLMTTGWPMSERHIFNAYDPAQFTNVQLSGRTPPLMSYPRWYCINNHSLYKMFFIEHNFVPDMQFI